MPAHMVRLALGAAISVTALSACKKEPSFDERYASAHKVIQEKAAELEKDMSSRAADAQPSPIPRPSDPADAT
ncbi:hypothetical protein ABVV53_05390 [Novosphingobium sp. RD2P27]|uniref:Lipoprotein n=1 Tax=Novosphingobium kalidii TaxID=3230299 RepID=A0ABV2CZ71_9SPHN